MQKTVNTSTAIKTLKPTKEPHIDELGPLEEQEEEEVVGHTRKPDSNVEAVDVEAVEMMASPRKHTDPQLPDGGSPAKKVRMEQSSLRKTITKYAPVSKPAFLPATDRIEDPSAPALAAASNAPEPATQRARKVTFGDVEIQSDPKPANQPVRKVASEGVEAQSHELSAEEAIIPNNPYDCLYDEGAMEWAGVEVEAEADQSDTESIECETNEDEEQRQRRKERERDVQAGEGFWVLDEAGNGIFPIRDKDGKVSKEDGTQANGCLDEQGNWVWTPKLDGGK